MQDLLELKESLASRRCAATLTTYNLKRRFRESKWRGGGSFPLSRFRRGRPDFSRLRVEGASNGRIIPLLEVSNWLEYRQNGGSSSWRGIPELNAETSLTFLPTIVACIESVIAIGFELRTFCLLFSLHSSRTIYFSRFSFGRSVQLPRMKNLG